MSKYEAKVKTGNTGSVVSNPASSFTPAKSSKVRQELNDLKKKRAQDRISSMGGGVGGGMGIGTTGTRNKQIASTTKEIKDTKKELRSARKTDYKSGSGAGFLGEGSVTHAQSAAKQSRADQSAAKQRREQAKKYAEEVFPTKYANLSGRKNTDAELEKLKNGGRATQQDYELLKQDQYYHWTRGELESGVQDTDKRIKELQADLENNMMFLGDEEMKNRTKEIESLKSSSEAQRRALESMAYGEEYAKLPEKLQKDLANNVGKWQEDTLGLDREVSNPKLNKQRSESQKKLQETKKQLKSLGYKDEQIDGMLEYAKRVYNAKQAQEKQKKLEGLADKSAVGKVFADVKSVGANLAGGIPAVIDLAIQRIGNKTDPFTGARMSTDFNSNAQGLANYARQERAARSEGMDSTEAFFYNTGMSIADFLLASRFGGKAAEIVLGASAAQAAAQEAHERGASDDQALLVGLTAGLAEATFEHISLEKLRGFQAITDKVAKGSARLTAADVAKSIGVQSFTEGSEELATTLANTLTDAMIMADKSEINTAIQQNKAIYGMSEEEATRAAWKDWAKNLALDFAGGAVSGGVVGSTQGIRVPIYQARMNRSVGDHSTLQGNISSLQVGLTMPRSSASRQLADSIASRIVGGGTVANKDFGRLTNTLAKDIEKGVEPSAENDSTYDIQAGQNGEPVVTMRMGPIAESLASNGMSARDAVKNGNLLSVLLDGDMEDLSFGSIKDMAVNSAVRKTFEQMTNKTLPDRGTKKELGNALRTAAVEYREERAEAQRAKEETEAVAEAQAAEQEQAVTDMADQMLADADSQAEAQAAQVADETDISGLNPPAKTREEFIEEYRAKILAEDGINVTDKQAEKAWQKFSGEDGVLLDDGRMIGRDRFFKEMREFYANRENNPIELDDEQLEDMYQAMRSASRTAPRKASGWSVEETETAQQEEPGAEVMSVASEQTESPVTEETAEQPQTEPPTAAEETAVATEQTEKPVEEKADKTAKESSRKKVTEKKTRQKKNTVIPTKAETEAAKAEVKGAETAKKAKAATTTDKVRLDREAELASLVEIRKNIDSDKSKEELREMSDKANKDISNLQRSANGEFTPEQERQSFDLFNRFTYYRDAAYNEPGNRDGVLGKIDTEIAKLQKSLGKTAPKKKATIPSKAESESAKAKENEVASLATEAVSRIGDGDNASYAIVNTMFDAHGIPKSALNSAISLGYITKKGNTLTVTDSGKFAAKAVSSGDTSVTFSKLANALGVESKFSVEEEAALKENVQTNKNVSQEQLLTALYLKPYLKKLGINRIIFDGDRMGDADGEIRGDTIYLNEHLATSTRAITKIIGHELIHPATSQTRKESGNANQSVAEEVISFAKRLNKDGMLSKTNDGETIRNQLENIDKEVEKRRERYTKYLKEQGASDDYIAEMTTDAMMREEIAADWFGIMLRNQNILERLAGIKPDLLTRVLRVIDRIRKTAPSGLIVNNNRKEFMKYLKELDDLTDRVNGALTRAKAAKENSSETEEQTDSERYSVKSVFNAAGLNVENENGVYKVYDKNGKPINKVTPQMVNDSSLGAMINLAATGIERRDRNGNVKFFSPPTISAEDAKEQINAAAELLNMMVDAQDGALVWNFAGATLFSAVKTNSDGQYSITIDFSTVCRKTRSMMEAMSNAMVDLGRGLTKDEVIDIQDRVIKEGGEVNCPVCYVFSRWAGIGGILENMKQFQEKYGKEYDDDAKLNDAIQDLERKLKNKKDLRAALLEYDTQYQDLTRDVENINDELKELRKDRRALAKEAKQNAELKEELAKKDAQIDGKVKDRDNAKKELKKLEADSTPELAWLKRVRAVPDGNGGWKSNPNYWNGGFVGTKNKSGEYKTDVKTLFNLEDAASFVEKYPTAWAYRTSRGPAAGKAILPYSDMVLGDFILGPKSGANTGNEDFKDTTNGEFNSTQMSRIESAIRRVLAQNLIGGQRFQSTSDFRFDYGLDYLMAFWELQAVGSTMQSYTKVPDFVNLAAAVGGDVNISMMPRNSGVDENGKLIYSDVTGVDPDEAYKLNALYDNAQLILVGINDKHIAAALEDNTDSGGAQIGFVIPYHASGASINEYISKLLKNLGEEFQTEYYKDYSKLQTDSAKKVPNSTDAQVKVWIDAMKRNPQNPDFGNNKPSASQLALLERKLRAEIRTALLTGKASFLNEDGTKGNSNESNAKEFIASALGLIEGESKDISRMSFERLSEIERRALAGDADAIREYESWSAGILSDLYQKMWVDESAYSTYDVRLTSQQAHSIMPHEYWNKRVNRDKAYVNGFIFRSYCHSLGLYPRFSGYTSSGQYLNYGDFTSTAADISQDAQKGYWKLLIDRPMYDNNGRYREQNRINATDVLKITEEGVLDADLIGREDETLKNSTPAKRAASSFVRDHQDTARQSIPSDEEYMAAVDRGDMKAAQKMVDEAAKKQGLRIFDSEYRTLKDLYDAVDRGELLIHARRLAPESIDELEYGLEPTWGSTMRGTEMAGWYDETGNTPPELIFASDGTMWSGDERNGIVFVRSDNFQRSNGDGTVTLPDGSVVRYEMSPIADFENPVLREEPAGVETGDWYTNQTAEVVAAAPFYAKSADPVTYDDDGKVIPLSERFNPKQSDIRYSLPSNADEMDRQYMDAVESGDTARAQRMVDEAARRAGYDSPKLYHGTNAFGFTEVDVSKSDDGISFFATSDPKIAATYTRVNDVKRIKDADSGKRVSGNYRYKDLRFDTKDEYEEFKKKYPNYVTELELADIDDFDEYDDAEYERRNAIEEYRLYERERLYPTTARDLYEHPERYTVEDLDRLIRYLSNGNVFIGDFGYLDYPRADSEVIREFFEDTRATIESGDYEPYESFDEYLNTTFPARAPIGTEYTKTDAGVYEMYAKLDNMLELDAKNRRWNDIQYDGADVRDTLGHSTRSIAKWAKGKGYSGVIYRNIRDNGAYSYVSGKPGDVYVFFEPKTQVKSADPITYDSDGNIVPLSERFRTDRTGEDEWKNRDIRYSVTAPKLPQRMIDEYDRAIQTKNTEEAQRLVDEAAETALANSKLRTPDGKLRKVYHGTNSGEFHVFDPGMIGASSGDSGFFGRGFYFAYTPGEARYYGNRIMEAYLNIENPFNFETELGTLDGERSRDYNGSRAVFAVNFADKFPELADSQSVSAWDKDGNYVNLPLKQFAEEFMDVYNNVKFEKTEMDGAYGKEWLVTAGKHQESFTDESGTKHTWDEYTYQSRAYDEAAADDKAAHAFGYLAKTKYSGIQIPASAAIVMDTNFTEALQARGYDGAIQSEAGDEAVVFDSSQIKSADPFTYNDEGKAIPLSERFNPKQSDIRYSLSPKAAQRVVDGSAQEDLDNLFAEFADAINAPKSFDPQAVYKIFREDVENGGRIPSGDREKAKEILKKIDSFADSVQRLQSDLQNASVDDFAVMLTPPGEYRLFIDESVGSLLADTTGSIADRAEKLAQDFRRGNTKDEKRFREFVKELYALHQEDGAPFYVYGVEYKPTAKAQSAPVSAFTEKGRFSLPGENPDFDEDVEFLRKYMKEAKFMSGMERAVKKPGASVETKEGRDALIGDMFSNYGMGSKKATKPKAPPESKLKKNTYNKLHMKRQFGEEHAQAYEDADFTYDRIAEEESMARADERLRNDYDGEKNDLSERNWHSSEDLDTAMGILATELRAARDSGDFSEVLEWLHIIREQATQAGQFIQAFAKYNRTPEGVIARAAEDLRKTDLSKQNREELLEKITQFAVTLDALKPNADGKTDSKALVDLIVAQAKQRNTPVPKHVLNALQRQANQGNVQYLYDAALTQLDQIAKDYVDASTGKKIATFQTIMHLLNLKTANRNLLSNTVFGTLAATANNVAMMPDLILSLMTGGRSVGFDAGHFSGATWKGVKDGGSRARIEAALDIQPDAGAKDKYGTSRRTWKMTGNFVQRNLSRLEKAMAYELNWTDEFRKGGVRAEIIHGLAPLVANGTITMDTAKAWANEEALYRTFQDDTYMNKALGLIKKLFNMKVITEYDAEGNKHRRLGQVDFGMGDIIQKYTQVPGALLTRAFEFAPTGYIKAIYQLGRLASAKKAYSKANKNAAEAKEDAEGKDSSRLKYAAENAFKSAQAAEVRMRTVQRDAALAMGRAMTGTGLIAAIAWLAKMGLLHRDDDEMEADAKSLRTAQGITGTQLNMSALYRLITGGSAKWQDGDVLSSVEFLEPINNLLTMGTKIAQTKAENEDANVWDYTLDTADALYRSILEIPTMQTAQTIYNVAKYHQEDDPLPVWADIPIEVALSGATGFVASPIRQLAQATDPYYRDTYAERGLVNKTKAQMMNALPYFRQQLPTKLDSFGRERTQEKQPLNALNAFIMPGTVRTLRSDPVANEVLRLYEETGEKSVLPARNAPYSVDTEDGKKQLTGEERRTYQKTIGSKELDTMDAAMKNPIYKDSDNDVKADVWSNIKSYAGYEARKAVGGKVNYNKDGSEDLPTNIAWSAKYDGGISAKAIKGAWMSKAKADAGLSGNPTNAELIHAVTSSNAPSEIKSELLEKNVSEAGMKKFNGAMQKNISPELYVKILEATTNEKMPANGVKGGHKSKVNAYLDDLVKQGILTAEQATYLKSLGLG